MTYHVMALRLHAFLVADCSVYFSHGLLVPSHRVFSAGAQVLHTHERERERERENILFLSPFLPFLYNYYCLFHSYNYIQLLLGVESSENKAPPLSL